MRRGEEAGGEGGHGCVFVRVKVEERSGERGEGEKEKEKRRVSRVSFLLFFFVVDLSNLSLTTTALSPFLPLFSSPLLPFLLLFLLLLLNNGLIPTDRNTAKR